MDGLTVCRTIYAPPSDRIIDPSIPDHCISLHIANPGNKQRRLERRLDGEKAIATQTFPGTFTFVPAFRKPEWLWESNVEILDLYLPALVLDKIVMENYERSNQNIELIDRFAINDPLLEQLVKTLYTERSHNNSNNRLYLESLQNLVAVHLLQNHCSVRVLDTPLSGRLSKSKLQRILDYIQDNLDRNMGLEELADLVQLSSHHLRKLFKQSMGISLHQYVLQCRIERAKTLLKSTDLSIAQIAQLVSFYDQSHFTNVFRRYTKLTPRQYRSQF